ncbi:MAG: sigma-70 family RNA polymerase sigma factor [Candidatus Pacearchaeota archaeon]|nr:sigma-70 family RNA polymerase sigma factor [Candidatus Pacearchaeota archaeon]
MVIPSKKFEKFEISYDDILKAREGNDAAFEKIYKGCEGIIMKIITQNYNKTLSFLEKLQTARISLWNAILSYNKKRNAKFTTYAYKCISTSLKNVYRTYKKNYYFQGELSTDSIENIDNSAEPYQIIKHSLKNSLDKIIVKKILEKAKEFLNKREIIILKDYFLEEKTLEEIGKKLNISRERVRVIRNGSVTKIKEKFQKEINFFKFLYKSFCY